MALDGTYTGLLASAAATLHRSDLTSYLPDWVVLAEAQMNRRIMARRKISRATTTINAEYATLPTDFAGIRTMRLTDGTKPHLKSISPEGMADLKDGNVPIGEPIYYAIVGNEFEFYPVPDASYTASIAYYASLPALATNSSNWVLTSHPDAYLYGTLLQSAPWLKADERLQVWGTLFTSALDDINAQSLNESMGGAIAPMPSSGLIA